MDKDTGKTPGQLYDERLKRVDDAIELKVPDRVPVICNFGLLAARYTGMPVKDTYYEPEKMAAAHKKTIVDFAPDMFWNNQFRSGRVWEIVDTKIFKWPGHGVSIDHVQQFVEDEYMKADEYDAFIQDPGDFILRKYLPRACGALVPLQTLPHLNQFIFIASGLFGGGPLTRFAQPEVVNAFEALREAGLEQQRWLSLTVAFLKEMEKLGFPTLNLRGATQPPYDFIENHFRGMRGMIMDMYRQPNKIFEAMDRVLPLMIQQVKDIAAATNKSDKKGDGHPLIIVGPHRGYEGALSPKHFDTFYWPGLKKVIQAIVDEGMRPFLWWEGDYTSRLEYFLELPEGKVVSYLDTTDIFKAKEVLGGHHCIVGGVSSALLQTATVQEVKDRCKKLIDVVGKDGGYIMCNSCALDEANPENVKAMIDTCKEYGVYN
jgi:hypothetical protein